MSEAKNLFASNSVIQFNPDLSGVGDKSVVFSLGNDYLPKGEERVVYAPSPAQILTKPDILTRLGNAFRLLVAPPKLPPMIHRIVRHDGDLPLWEFKDVVLDIETSGDVEEDRPEYSRIISIAVYDGGSMVYVIPEEIIQSEGIIQWLHGELLRKNRIITVNGKFDLKYFLEEPKDHFDVQLASYSLFPAAGEHGLKPLAKNIFGADDWDEPGKKYTRGATYKERTELEDGAWADARKYRANSGFERIPRKMLYEYNAYDVYWTWHLKVWAEELLAESPDSTRVFNFLMKLSSMFLRAEKRGLTYDVDHLVQLETVLQHEFADEKAKLNEIAGRVLNPNSPKQVVEWFAEQGRALPLRKSRKKMPNGAVRIYQKPSSSEDALTEVIESDSYTEQQRAFAEQLIKVRYYNKMLGTYVTGYLNQLHGCRGFPTLKLFASITGRLGGGGPSPLTLPREKRLKQMVIASAPNRRIATADLSQAELRVMALESGDEWLIAAFQPEAGDFFDILLEQAYPDKDWHQMHFNPKDSEEAEWYNNMRAAMKGVVYGASFARGVPAIAKSLKISIEEAQKLYDGFIRPGSTFDLWRKEIERKAVSGEPITTIYGRHFQSELITDKNKDTVTRSALSFTSQSTANDLCLDAALHIEPQLAQYDAWLLTTLHDAIYVDAPEEHAETVARLIAHEMQQAGIRAYGTRVLFKSDGGVGVDMAHIYDLAA